MLTGKEAPAQTLTPRQVGGHGGKERLPTHALVVERKPRPGETQCFPRETERSGGFWRLYERTSDERTRARERER